MAVPPQQQTTPTDHHYFEWSASSQQKLVEQSLKVVPIGLNQPQLIANNVHTNNTTNMAHNHPHLHNHPLMTHTHRRQYYQHFEEKRSFEDSKQKPNKPGSGMTPPNANNPISLSPSPTPNNFNSTGHVRKKQKTNTNGIGSSSSTSSLNTSDDHSQSQTCYPFQAELTQKIDIECGSSSNGGVGPTAHTPTHHFTLSTVINVSVNGQTSQQSSQNPNQQQTQQQPMKYLDPNPSPSSLSQQQCPTTSSDQQDFLGHPSSSPSVLSNSSPSISSPSTMLGAMTNSNNNNPNPNSISNLISSTPPSTHMLSQSPSTSHPSSSAVSLPIIFSGINISMYMKDLDLTTFDSINLGPCPNPQDYLTLDGLLTFLNTCNNSLFMSDNNNNNLSMQKSMDYSRRYQTQIQTQQQMMTRSDSMTLRQTPYLPNPTQQYHDTYRMPQQQQQQQQTHLQQQNQPPTPQSSQIQQPQQQQQSQYMYNYTRTQQFEQQTRYYSNQYPSMMTPYPYPSSYPYPSHNQVN